MRTALITGVSGHVLTDDERAFYRDVRPAGVNPVHAQLSRSGAGGSASSQSIREAVGADDFLVLIDQEGGRVQRLRGRTGPGASARRAPTATMFTVRPRARQDGGLSAWRV